MSSKQPRPQHKTTKKPKPPTSTTTTTPSTSTPSTPPTLYFWRHTDPQTGWLSQWYPCAFTDPAGTTYQTAEHYMMYHKALLFNDTATAQLILNSSDPREAQALGRKVSNFNEDVWKANRVRIVEEGTRYKFTRVVNGEGLRKGVGEDAEVVGEGGLRGLLLGTGERELVEASPRDAIWGIGFGERKGMAERNRGRWGLNLLGKALVRVRGELRGEEEGGWEVLEG